MFYENYLNSLKPDTSYIPESVSEMDKCIFAERAFQDALNEAFFAIATQEMAIFESAINEAEGDKPASTEAKKKLLDIIKDAATSIWEHAKGFYLHAIETIKETFANFKKEKGDKIKSDFKNAKLPADFVAKNIFNFGEAKAVYGECLGAIAGIGTYAQSKPKEGYSKEAAIKAAVDGAKKDNAAPKVVNDSFSADGLNLTKSDVKGSEIISNADIVIDFVFNAGKWVKMVKMTYDHNKKIIDGLLKAAKEAMNQNKDKNYNKVAKENIKAIKELTAVLTKLCGISNSAIRAVRANYVGLVAKVIATSKKAVKEDTEITIDVKDESPEDTEVKVDAPEAPATDVEVKDEVEEACAGFVSEEAEEDEEFEATVDETEGCKSCKEDVDIEVNVEDSDDDDVEDVEESALYRALYAYLG